ncbi:MAG: hypothetical protein AAFO95_13730 [Cyanobacteria bacterium J06600_6]
MNALEQVKNLGMISKVEAIAYLFRREFSECIADLKPWIQSEETKQFCDPNSIDIAFCFPDPDFSCQCQNVLMQVKIDPSSNQSEYCAVAIKLSGYAAYQEQWQFSTIGYWEFFGISKPTIATQVKLKNICRQILNLFNSQE